METQKNMKYPDKNFSGSGGFPNLCPEKCAKKFVLPHIREIRFLLICLTALSLLCVSACSERDIGNPGPVTDGFTFFNIGKNTMLDKKIERELKARLGHCVTERWRSIDLSMNYKGFLLQYFPKLHELNQKLKNELVLKTEDNPLRLTYRHTRKKNTRFAFVELTFSNHSGKPLLFRIKPKNESPDILDAMKEKYGEPHIIDWDEKVAYGKKGRSFYWKKNKDIFMISVSPDRYGNPEYHIFICYSGNIGEEHELREKRNGEKKNREMNAF